MSISVTAEKSVEGWVLVSADEFKDILAGPTATEEEIRSVAKELDLSILSTKRQKSKVISQVGIGTRFRVDEFWYALVKLDGKKAILRTLGTSDEASLPANTPVTEISILDLN